MDVLKSIEHIVVFFLTKLCMGETTIFTRATPVMAEPNLFKEGFHLKKASCGQQTIMSCFLIYF